MIKEVLLRTMAEAKKTTTVAAKTSKRKALIGKKSQKTKVKLTKTDAVVEVKAAVETEVQELVVTSRHKRMAEKAKVRAALPKAEIADVGKVRITDVSGVVYDEDEYNAMVEMYDATIRDIREGEIVSGTILGVTRDDVIVDVGFKSEGIIPIQEFTGVDEIKVGDAIEVFLEQIEDSHGQLILSKQKADFMRVWDQIREFHDSGEKVEGSVVRRIKGGLVVDVMGVDAFLPGSQVALRQVPDFDALINQTMELKIIKINKARRNIVVSRRMVLEAERESMRDELLADIAVEQVRKGIVKNITDFGVFIDLGGVDGLLHITDMSWGRIRHPSEMVTLGEEIDIKILDIDEKTSRISLGLKQMTPYPWEDIETKYPIGDKIVGRVVSITDYGSFIELEKGIEGLIHISEMSWTQHIKHPSKIMSVNDNVEAVVLSVDKDNEKISLGIKQMEPDPWQTIDAKYPIEKIISGKVRNLTAFGAFVELEEGIDGLVHISDMSWTKRIQHPSEVMKKNDTVEVKVIKVDHDNRRISLGLKQLSEDPWAEIAEKYAIGTECLGTITKVMDRGVIVDLDGTVEGFVPTAQLGKKGLSDASTAFKAGEELHLHVIEFDRKQHKVVLSVEAYYKTREQSELDEYLSQHESSEVPSAMADAMPDALKEAAANADETPAPAKKAKVEEAPAEEAKADEAPEAKADDADDAAKSE